MPVFEPVFIGCISYIFEVSNFKYKVYLKNESIYLFQKFKENPPTFTKLSWMSFLFCLCFTPIFIFFIYSFQIVLLCCISWSSLCMSLCFLRCCLHFSLTVLLRVHDSAVFFGCCGEWVHVQSMREERYENGHLFLWLMQYGTRGKCPSSCCKVSFLTFLNWNFMLAFLQLNGSVCSLSVQ
jgi:hypothetical protein